MKNLKEKAKKYWAFETAAVCLILALILPYDVPGVWGALQAVFGVSTIVFIAVGVYKLLKVKKNG